MLAIFNKAVVQPPQELNSPATPSAKKPKQPDEIVKEFMSCHDQDNAFSVSFGNKSMIAYVGPQNTFSTDQRLFCCLDDIYCVFMGSLNNLSSLIKQYGLSKNTNEAMFVVQAYRTLRDRGPYPADQVIKDLDGSFGFVIYDRKAGTVFVSLDANDGVSLYWGIAGDGSVVISDNLGVLKESCSKSFAQFPTGCIFHSEQGLMSFEHPTQKMKAMPRIDSEGVMCGANFKVDAQSKVQNMPRVGSEANWAAWGQQA